MQKKPYSIGIDEAGRGPVAGPVAVAAFLVTPELLPLIEAFEISLKDSKKLSPQKRQIWYEAIRSWQKKGLCVYAVTMAGAGHIDKKGISHAISHSLKRSLYKVETRMCEKYGLCEVDFQILLDGGLRAPKEYLYQETIIKGDEKVKCIALASIVAKVERDRYMDRVDARYVEYGFIEHKGYGTSSHMKAIKKHGLSPLHRKTFLTKV